VYAISVEKGKKEEEKERKKKKKLSDKFYT
jgi:hypothetical protein